MFLIPIEKSIQVSMNAHKHQLAAVLVCEKIPVLPRYVTITKDSFSMASIKAMHGVKGYWNGVKD